MAPLLLGFHSLEMDVLSLSEDKRTMKSSQLFLDGAHFIFAHIPMARAILVVVVRSKSARKCNSGPGAYF